MSLAVAEEVLMDLGVPFEKEKQGILLKTSSPRTENTYLIFISEDEESAVRLTTKFCSSKHEIEQPHKLCEELNKSMQGVALHFSKPQKTFYMWSCIPSRSLVRNLDNFLKACDFVFPVCDQVSTTGKWDDNLAFLARCDISQIHQA